MAVNKVLAKFQVNSVEKFGFPGADGKPFTNSIKAHMSPVCPRGDETDLNDENTRFAKYTPAGECWLQVDNPNVFDFFEPGAQLYVTFEVATAPNNEAEQ